MPHEDEQFDQLPPAIIDALRELDGPAVLPDAQRDADVLSGARQHLAKAAPVDRKRRNLRLFFAGGAGGAIAAAVMIAFVLFLSDPKAEQYAADVAATPTWTEGAPAEPPSPPQPVGDIDHDGTLDILDAYALAKQFERGQHTTAMDANGDGRVDPFDIDWIANQAVQLNTGERG